MSGTNPDREVLRDFLSAGGEERAIASNPIAQGLHAMLLAADPETGTARIRFEPAAAHLQGAGHIHGGVVATMLDLTLAFAALARLPADQSPATVSLNVNMLRPVAPGVVTAAARIDRAGRRVLHASAQLTRGDGELLATATTVMVVTPTA